MTFEKIRIVTDSTCDIPAELLKRYHIAVVPCFVNYSGQSFADDGVHLVREQFYHELPRLRPLPKTAAPSPAVAERIITQAFEDADRLVILTVPIKLSSLYNSLRLGASGLPQDRVTLIDTGTTTLGMGWQVLIAAQVAEATGDLSQVLDAIERARRAQRVYAALSTLEYLRESGRVGWAAASIGTLLNIKPVIEVRESEVHSIARVRTFGRALDELEQRVRSMAPLDRLAIMHCDNPDGAHELHDRLRGIAPAETLVVHITPTIGTYTGPGAVGVAPVSSSWKV